MLRLFGNANYLDAILHGILFLPFRNWRWRHSNIALKHNNYIYPADYYKSRILFHSETEKSLCNSLEEFGLDYKEILLLNCAREELVHNLNFTLNNINSMDNWPIFNAAYSVNPAIANYYGTGHPAKERRKRRDKSKRFLDKICSTDDTVFHRSYHAILMILDVIADYAIKIENYQYLSNQSKDCKDSHKRKMSELSVILQSTANNNMAYSLNFCQSSIIEMFDNQLPKHDQKRLSLIGEFINKNLKSFYFESFEKIALTSNQQDEVFELVWKEFVTDNQMKDSKQMTDCINWMITKSFFSSEPLLQKQLFPWNSKLLNLMNMKTKFVSADLKQQVCARDRAPFFNRSFYAEGMSHMKFSCFDLDKSWETLNHYINGDCIFDGFEHRANETIDQMSEVAYIDWLDNLCGVVLEWTNDLTPFADIHIGYPVPERLISFQNIIKSMQQYLDGYRKIHISLDDSMKQWVIARTIR
jgi:hypothetical protein